MKKKLITILMGLMLSAGLIGGCGQPNNSSESVKQEETAEGKEVTGTIDEIKDFPHIRVKGLMTIAPFVDDPEDNRVYFRKLKDLSLDIQSKSIDNIDMSVLSMGMTNDYEVAVEEGATLVRVGTGIFGARNYNI